MLNITNAYTHAVFWEGLCIIFVIYLFNIVLEI